MTEYYSFMTDMAIGRCYYGCNQCRTSTQSLSSGSRSRHPSNDIALFIQARIAEEAGACAVMALERVPADIRKEGGVARMVRQPLCLITIIYALTTLYDTE